MGRLDVRIIEARNLPDDSITGSGPDPYVTVEIETRKFQTTAAHSRKNPKYDEVFKFTVADPSSARLVVKVFNKGAITDDFLGEYRLSVDGLTKGAEKDSWYLLKQCKTNAEIRIALLAIDFGNDPVDVVSAVSAGAAVDGSNVVVVGEVVGEHRSSWAPAVNTNNNANVAPVPVPPRVPGFVFEQPQWNPEIQQTHQPGEIERVVQKVGKSFENAVNSLVTHVAAASLSSAKQ